MKADRAVQRVPGHGGDAVRMGVAGEIQDREVVGHPSEERIVRLLVVDGAG